VGSFFHVYQNRVKFNKCRNRKLTFENRAVLKRSVLINGHRGENQPLPDQCRSWLLVFTTPSIAQATLYRHRYLSPCFRNGPNCYEVGIGIDDLPLISESEQQQMTE